MKIKVKASPSEEGSKTFTFDPADHGFTDKQWKKLPKHEKWNQIMQFLEALPEQPYWSIDDYEEV